MEDKITMNYNTNELNFDDAAFGLWCFKILNGKQNKKRKEFYEADIDSIY